MMNTDKVLGKILGDTKRKNKDSSKTDLKKTKPVREFEVADKKVQVFNDNPVPKKNTMKKVYSKMLDDTKIPLQFMTRKQYMNRYIKNQERKNNIDFSKNKEQQFIKKRTPHYNNIVGRYTTRDNPYYKPAVVVFNDKDNFDNIKGDNFKEFAWHEYGHELAEKNGIQMPLHKEELFADNISEYGTSRKIYSDKRAMNYAKKNIKQDEYSENSSKPNRLMRERIDKLDLREGEVYTDVEDKDLIIKPIDDPQQRKTARKRLRRTLKKYPELVSDLEQDSSKTVVSGRVSKHGADALYQPFITEKGEIKNVIAIDTLGENTRPEYDARRLKHEFTHANQIKDKSEDEIQSYFMSEANKPWHERSYEQDAQRESYQMVGRMTDPKENKELYNKYVDYLTRKRFLTDSEEEEYEEELNRLEDENYKQQNKELQKSAKNTFAMMNEENIETDEYSDDKKNIKFDNQSLNMSDSDKTSKERSKIGKMQFTRDRTYKPIPEDIESDNDSENMAQLHETWKHNDAIFFTDPKNRPDTIFVNKKNLGMLNQGRTEEDLSMIADMITHEELHHELYDIGGMKTSSQLDAITPVPVPDDSNNIINKQDVGSPTTSDEARFKTIQSLNRKIPADASEQTKWRTELSNEEKTHAMYDKFANRSDKFDIKQDNQSENLRLWKKREQPEDYEYDEKYPEVTDEQFQREQQDKQIGEQLDEYGERKKYSGQKVGNTMIAVDSVLPTAKVGTLAGLGVRKYVENINVEKTDEHDEPYKVPRLSFELKNHKDRWNPKHFD